MPVPSPPGLKSSIEYLAMSVGIGRTLYGPRRDDVELRGRWNIISVDRCREDLTMDAAAPKTLDNHSHVVRPAKMEWKKTRFPGCEVKGLLLDQQTGLVTALMRLGPGAVLPDHEHVKIEQTFVLEGKLVDKEGPVAGLSVGAGEFVWREAGTRHVAWTPEGGLMLARRPRHRHIRRRLATAFGATCLKIKTGAALRGAAAGCGSVNNHRTAGFRCVPKALAERATAAERSSRYKPRPTMLVQRASRLEAWRWPIYHRHRRSGPHRPTNAKRA